MGEERCLLDEVVEQAISGVAEDALDSGLRRLQSCCLLDSYQGVLADMTVLLSLFGDGD